MNHAPTLQFRVALPLEAAELAVREALAAHGFGILTEVDLAATLRAKLGVETAPHRLLGACNPRLAHASVEAEPAVAAFLPCGISLRQGSTPAETLVAIQDPYLMADAFEVPALMTPADEARKLLREALLSVAEEV